ncbi:Hsp20/alpha crystallin family protein [Streptomyces sp. NP160]|uniref:Hsp20/alpha crystallin family protein n=1 Tax=Streptomyces sp. NP160 TaxID=2586637 RepID=UPI00111899C6|nr:Hsp20/alpha crystallin family protein [Streptomyces sp. NP160]TNM68436.1 Hsp20/alpha crystallin family protein [Streptomyces sp. NP160]
MSTLVLRRPALRTWAFDVPAPAAPAVSLERDGEDGVLTAEAPGLDPARDLSVQVTGDRLVVAGARRQVLGGVRREARFSRTVRLPEGVTADAVSARYDAGVLRVRVAGMFPAPVQPETVTVAIASDVAPVEQPEQPEQPAA